MGTWASVSVNELAWTGSTFNVDMVTGKERDLTFAISIGSDLKSEIWGLGLPDSAQPSLIWPTGTCQPRASGVCTNTQLKMGTHFALCQPEGLPLSNTHTSHYTNQDPANMSTPPFVRVTGESLQLLLCYLSLISFIQPLPSLQN